MNGTLNSDATVGVWAPHGTGENGQDVEGKFFGKYTGDAQELFIIFKNDKYALVGRDGGSGRLTWGKILCKIVDQDEKEHIFSTLNDAVTHSRNNPKDYVSGVCTIQMLLDYTMPSADKVTLNQNTDNIILTTAPTEKADEDPDCADAHKFEMSFTDGKHATTTSSDGTATYKDKNGNTVTLAKGEVLLSKVPPKTFYLKETTVPAGYAAENGNTVYEVSISSTGVPTIKRAEGTDPANYPEAFKVETKAASGSDPAEYRYVIMNKAEAVHKAVLRKTGSAYQPLEGARFRIFNAADMTEITEGQPVYKPGESILAGKALGDSKGYYEAGKTGVYFSGRLAEGRYFLVEIQAPNNADYSGNAGKVFVMTVDANGGCNPGNAKATVRFSPETDMMTDLKALAGEYILANQIIAGSAYNAVTAGLTDAQKAKINARLTELGHASLIP